MLDPIVYILPQEIQKKMTHCLGDDLNSKVRAAYTYLFSSEGSPRNTAPPFPLLNIRCSASLNKAFRDHIQVDSRSSHRRLHSL